MSKRPTSEIIARVLGEALVGIMVGCIILLSLAALLFSLGIAHRAMLWVSGSAP